MVISMKDVQQVFDQLISEKIKREEADRWAYDRVKAFDSNLLEFHPISNEELIWEAISYLYGIDIQISSGEYMHSIDGIKKNFEEKWKNI